MKNLLIVTFCFLIFQLGAQHKKSLKPFHSVSVSTSIDATIIQGDQYKLEYRMVKGDKSGLIISEDDGELKITTKNKGMWSGSSVKAKVTIYCQDINNIDVTAGAKISTERVLNSKKLDINISSGGLAVMDITNENCNVNVSSGGNLVLKGEGKNIDVDVSSGGYVNAEDFKVQNADTDVSSGGSAKVWCTESLDVDASSGGSVKYKGDPKKTDIDKGMSGSVSKI